MAEETPASKAALAAAAAAAGQPTPKTAAPRKTGTSTVAVACKLPNGMLLQNCEMMEVSVPLPGSGYITQKEGRRVGPVVRLNGFAYPLGIPKAAPTWPIVGGYGITPDVDEAFMTKWMHDHRNDDVVTNRLIFICDSVQLAMGRAAEQEEIPSNLDGIDPEHPEKYVRDRNAKVMLEKGDLNEKAA